MGGEVQDLVVARELRKRLFGRLRTDEDPAFPGLFYSVDFPLIVGQCRKP